MTQERLLRSREVAECLAVSRSTVYRWFWDGRLAGCRFENGSVRIYESSVRNQKNYFADGNQLTTPGDERLLLLAYAKLMVARG